MLMYTRLPNRLAGAKLSTQYWLLNPNLYLAPAEQLIACYEQEFENALLLELETVPRST